MNGFNYNIQVQKQAGPRVRNSGFNVFEFDRWMEPSEMYAIVRRLRSVYSWPEYSILVDIVDVTHTRVIEGDDKLPLSA